MVLVYADWGHPPPQAPRRSLLIKVFFGLDVRYEEPQEASYNIVLSAEYADDVQSWWPEVGLCS